MPKEIRTYKVIREQFCKWELEIEVEVDTDTMSDEAAENLAFETAQNYDVHGMTPDNWEEIDNDNVELINTEELDEDDEDDEL